MRLADKINLQLQGIISASIVATVFLYLSVTSLILLLLYQSFYYSLQFSANFAVMASFITLAYIIGLKKLKRVK